MQMTRTNLRAATLALAATASLVLAPVPAMAQSEQQRLVNQADTTLSNFLRDPEMTWLQQNIGRARAVLIAPEIVKAGFIFGGSGGRAVLLAKEGSKWNGPSFYTMATASVGFQAGVSVSEVVTLVMTQKGMDRLRTQVLDTSLGRPGAGIEVTVYRADDARVRVASAFTNADLRTDRPLLEGEAFARGIYEIEFGAAAYFARSGATLSDPP